ncbi:MerR family transcriptional regulator [Pseudonocardia sp.]|uniref:MerR family transcriptional regulator n=1 Tax=Pseudonocardia sp. TaxID=60912 RepID=UPI00261CE9CA|nr:MerR family transcriptional regulator [Pseudonocardia sp.]
MHPDPVPPAAGTAGDEPRLTVAAAARRLGVAPATLRTWDRRYGMGPGEHRPGRHRRYSPDDLARLELMQHALLRGASPADAAGYARAARLPRPGGDAADRPRPLPAVPREEGTPGPDVGGPVLLADDTGDGQAATRVRVGGHVLRLPGAGRAARGLGRAALALDAAAVRGGLREAVERGGVAHAWDEVARPVLVSVARRWADSGAGVEIEHLVSECVIGVFGRHAAEAPAPVSPRPVLLAGMPAEQHTLPLVVLAAALADRRVESTSLGSNLPLDALVAAVRRTAPAAVVLWAQMPATADVEVLRALPRTRPRFRTYVAGPGWTGVALPPRITWLGSLRDAERELVATVLV